MEQQQKEQEFKSNNVQAVDAFKNDDSTIKEIKEGSNKYQSLYQALLLDESKKRIEDLYKQAIISKQESARSIKLQILASLLAITIKEPLVFVIDKQVVYKSALMMIAEFEGKVPSPVIKRLKDKIDNSYYYQLLVDKTNKASVRDKLTSKKLA